MGIINYIMIFIYNKVLLIEILLTCCFCDRGFTSVILSEVCLLLVPGRQSHASRLLNSI